jgi:hypothetical protein
MITHEEDFDKSNLVLTVDTQRGLQSLFDYIIYLGIKVGCFFLRPLKFLIFVVQAE